MGLDVRDAVAVQERVDATATRLGGLDHVVLHGRGPAQDGRVSDCSPAELAEVIDVNLTGTLNVARAAYPHLRKSRGSMTAFASSSFTRGRPNYVAYSASKAAVVTSSRVWPMSGRTMDPRQRGQPGADGHAYAPPGVSRRGPRRTALVPGGRRGDAAAARLDLTGQVLDVRQHDPA